MKEKNLIPIYTALVILLTLFSAGCVAPPQENTTFNPMGVQTQTTQPTTQSFVSEVTLSDYGTCATQSSGYTTFIPPTQIPADITCRIHDIKVFGYNGSAFIFNLKVYTNPYSKQTETLTYSDYSPSSWFEVTVRNNATKEIILQDGFGPNKGYTVYLSRTLKVMKSGDLLVEFRGNEITASASIWVKPIGNFDDSRLSEFTDCTYWDSHRDTLTTPPPTTIKGAIYTWTIENQVKDNK
jgi:hypothetical protein